MSDAAAFTATYSNWRVVQGRKVVQIVMEVPLEAAHHAYNVLGGMPNVDSETWFAIARMKKPEQEK